MRFLPITVSYASRAGNEVKVCDQPARGNVVSKSTFSQVRPGDTLPEGCLLWWLWLVAVTLGVMLFGISMVVAPGFIREFFSLLFYASSQHIDTFGEPAVAYITFAHGVLGAVMFGWGAALLCVLFGSFRRGHASGWRTLAISLTAWFVPDTVFSVWSGFWQNAILNVVLAVLFAIPLARTYKPFFNEPG